ncbi:MAG TPA: hypothetical protein VGM53_04880 [Streptosporangiaceae bacterium]
MLDFEAKHRHPIVPRRHLERREQGMRGRARTSSAGFREFNAAPAT